MKRHEKACILRSQGGDVSGCLLVGAFRRRISGLAVCSKGWGMVGEGTEGREGREGLFPLLMVVSGSVWFCFLGYFSLHVHVSSDDQRINIIKANKH